MQAHRNIHSKKVECFSLLSSSSNPNVVTNEANESSSTLEYEYSAHGGEERSVVGGNVLQLRRSVVKYNECKENTTEVIYIRVPLIPLVIASAKWLGCVDLLAVISGGRTLLSCQLAHSSKPSFAFFAKKFCCT